MALAAAALMCMVTQAVAAAGYEIVFVGTWTNASSVHALLHDPADGSLQRVSSTSLGGESVEALLLVGQAGPGPAARNAPAERSPRARATAVLVAASNPCNYRNPVSEVCEVHEVFPEICSLSTLAVTVDQDPGQGNGVGREQQNNPRSPEWKGVRLELPIL